MFKNGGDILTFLYLFESGAVYGPVETVACGLLKYNKIMCHWTKFWHYRNGLNFDTFEIPIKTFFPHEGNRNVRQKQRGNQA